jgi:hypothetical protein
LNRSRLAPTLGFASLAVASLLASAASAAPCAPVRVGRDGALPLAWSRAMNELEEATSVEGQAWSCTGGALTLAVDASGRFATLTLTDADGRRIERRIPRAEDLVPSAKALLAAPPAEEIPAPAPAPTPAPPPPVAIVPAPEAAPVIAREPRFLLDALLGARYHRPDNAIWGAATARAIIPFGAWSGGFWLRAAIPRSLEEHGESRSHITSEATLGLSGGRRLISGPFELHLTLDPSLTLAFEPVSLEQPSQPGQPPKPDRREGLSVHINPQIGLGLRGTFPLVGALRGAVALDGEFLPNTIGAGVSLGIEAVIR